MNFSKIALLGVSLGLSVACGKGQSETGSETASTNPEEWLEMIRAAPMKAARHVAPLYVKNGDDYQLICSATLTKKGVAVTAQHCITLANGRQLFVGGVYTGNTKLDSWLKDIAEAMGRNPYFRVTEIDTLFNYDVARIKYNKNNFFDNVVGNGLPIVDFPQAKQAIISGFGKRVPGQDLKDEHRSWSVVQSGGDMPGFQGEKMLIGPTGSGSCSGDSGGTAYFTDGVSIHNLSLDDYKAIGIVLGGVYLDKEHKTCESGITRVMPLAPLKCWLFDLKDKSCTGLSERTPPKHPGDDHVGIGTPSIKPYTIGSNQRYDKQARATGLLNKNCTVTAIQNKDRSRKYALTAGHCVVNGCQSIEWAKDGSAGSCSVVKNLWTAPVNEKLDIALLAVERHPAESITISPVESIRTDKRIVLFSKEGGSLKYTEPRDTDNKFIRMKSTHVVIHTADTEPAWSGSLVGLDDGESLIPMAMHFDTNNETQNWAIVLNNTVLNALLSGQW